MSIVYDPPGTRYNKGKGLCILVDGKIALIGEVAEVAHDEFETPVGNVYGVEIIANSIDTILKSGPLRPASLIVELIIGFLLLAVFQAPVTGRGSVCPVLKSSWLMNRKSAQ